MDKPTAVPLLDLAPEIAADWVELQEAISRVLRTARFILGPEVQAFEREFAEFLGVRHAVGCNSGTDALIIALRASGVQPGDEVITSPFSFVAAAEAVLNLGARPVFVDIQPDTFNLDPARLENAISSRSKAVIPVHLFGQAADMDELKSVASSQDLRVIEDVAQAAGGRFADERLGTIGDAGAFSFFPSKNLGAFGDAGLIATDSDQLADRARMLRTHGSRRKYHNEEAGYNSRLDELQAAVLRVRLKHLESWNERRRWIASCYDKAFAGTRVVVPAARNHHVYHQYTVRIPDGQRDALAEHLRQREIGAAVYYPVPIHRLPVFASDQHYDLPAAERASREVLSLPISPSLTDDQIGRVARTVVEFLG